MSDETNKDKEQPPASNSTDEALSKLLDSALADFNTKDTTKTDTTVAEVKPEEGDNAVGEIQPGAMPNFDEIWSTCFSPEGMKEFAEMFGGNGGDLDALKSNFTKLGEACQKNFVSKPNTAEDITAAFSGVLQDLNRNFAEFPGSEDLAGILNTEDSAQQLQSFVGNLFSKEIFYPSMKLMLEKFPTYMTEHADTITPENKLRYEKQQEILKEIIAEYDRETEQDTDEVHQARSKTIIDLVAKLEEHGEPPAELLNDMDTLPIPTTGGKPAECSIC